MNQVLYVIVIFLIAGALGHVWAAGATGVAFRERGHRDEWIYRDREPRRFRFWMWWPLWCATAVSAFFIWLAWGAPLP